MKKAIMCFIGAMMILSLAACTPTVEKNKTGEVKETEAAGVAADKRPDPDAPVLDIISIYSASEDGSKLVGTMESVETLDEQSLVDLLIQYKTLPEGTEVVSFTTEGEAASQEVGPGVTADSTKSATGILELTQIAEDDQKDLKLQAVADTFIENMNVENLTIMVDGKAVGENMSFVDAGK